jgi:hypothetical protein
MYVSVYECRYDYEQGHSYGWGGVVQPPWAAEAKGRQNEYFKQKKIFYALKKLKSLI